MLIALGSMETLGNERKRIRLCKLANTLWQCRIGIRELLDVIGTSLLLFMVS